MAAGFIPFSIAAGFFPSDAERQRELAVRVPIHEESAAHVLHGGWAMAIWSNCTAGLNQIARHFHRSRVASDYPGPVWRFLGLSLRHSMLALCFASFLVGNAEARFSIRTQRR